jgi:hypothetical protein
LGIKQGSWAKGVVGLGDDLSGIAETERQVPAVDVVERFVVIPGFLCVKDLEDAVWGGHLWGVSLR